MNSNSSSSQFLSKLINQKYGQMVATVLLKQNNYWIYHKNTIETPEQEKQDPAEKLWLVVRHMQEDKEHESTQGQGIKVNIGDTIKFGRVRYKIIMVHGGGETKKYNMHDRF